MHGHNDKNDGHKGMMWMMVICCALPLVLLLLGGSAVFAGGPIRYVIIGALALVCVSMMFKRHSGHDNISGQDTADTHDQSKTKNTSAEDGRCH